MIAMGSWFHRGPRNAAEWVARRHSGLMTPADHMALATWLDRKPENRKAYDRLNAAWGFAQGLQTSGIARQYLAEAAVKARPVRRAPPKTMMFGLAGGLAAATIALLVLMPERGVHATEPGEIQTVALEDGSTVWLNGDSKLRVDFTAPERRVVLERGEAFFKVAHDSSRPFVVDADTQRITVTGTQFDVRRASQSVDVAVTEGHVRVEPAVQHGAAAAAPVTALSAGDDAHFAAQVEPAVAHGVVAQHKGAWHEGEVYVDDLPLSAAIDEMNRYNHVKLVIGSDALRRETISANFRTGDVEEEVKVLGDLYGAKARREAGKIVLYKQGE
jgi:transmembrane sensor